MDVLIKQRIVVVDVEGNGQKPPDLVEVAVLPLSTEQIDLEALRSWLIRPARPIKRWVSQIHGITDKMVATNPTWDDTKVEVQEALEGAWIVAHNATVDYKVLSSHLPTWSPLGVFDTLRLSRALYPSLPSHSLDALIQHFGFDFPELSSKRHRAPYDVVATANLFLVLLRTIPSKNWDDLCLLACPPGLPGNPDPKQVKIW